MPKPISLKEFLISEIFEFLLSDLNSINVPPLKSIPKLRPLMKIKIKLPINKNTKLLKNLDEHIRNKTGIPVHVAEDPLLSVVKGTGIVLEDIKKYREVLITP